MAGCLYPGSINVISDVNKPALGAAQGPAVLISELELESIFNLCWCRAGAGWGAAGGAGQL